MGYGCHSKATSLWCVLAIPDSNTVATNSLYVIKEADTELDFNPNYASFFYTHL